MTISALKQNEQVNFLLFYDLTLARYFRQTPEEALSRANGSIWSEGRKLLSRLTWSHHKAMRMCSFADFVDEGAPSITQTVECVNVSFVLRGVYSFPIRNGSTLSLDIYESGIL